MEEAHETGRGRPVLEGYRKVRYVIDLDRSLTNLESDIGRAGHDGRTVINNKLASAQHCGLGSLQLHEDSKVTD